MKFTNNKINTVIVLLWGGISIGFSQKINLEEYKSRYPGESKVMLQYNTDYHIKEAGDSLAVEIVRYEETLCLDENAIMDAGQSLTYSGFFQIKNLAAQTLIPVNKKYKPVEVQKFDTSDYRQPSIFDDDVKKISFKFPKVQPGAITKLKYTHNLIETRFITPVYFNDIIPVEKTEITLTCPQNVNIGYKLFNCDSLKVDFSTAQKGSNIIYKWITYNAPKLKPEPDAPDIAYYAPHLFVYIKDYTVKGKKRVQLSNIDNLFNWYKTFISDVISKPAPTLKLLVDSLVSGISDRDQKAKKLFYWVQDHIKYIAFEAGREGFVPRDAELVYTRRFGDCKDMASITKKMLDYAGVGGHFVWLGTRHLPYSYSDLSLPAVDNHMIAAYKSNGSWVFLDATTGPHPYNITSYSIQGKEALIYTGPDSYEIVKIPAAEPEQSFAIDTLQIKLEDKKIIGQGISYFRGYSRFEMYNLIGQVDKTTQANILKRFFQKGNNKFLIDDFTIQNIQDRDKDLIISYRFNIADYAQLVGNELFINLSMEKPEQMDVIKPERKVAIESNFKRKISNCVILEIPSGYKVSYLPPNSEFKHELFSYHIKYNTTDKKVMQTRELISNYLYLPKKDFEARNKMTEQLKEAYKESINLTK